MTSCIAVEVCMIAILLLSLGLGLAVPIGAIIATTNLLSLVITYLFQLSRQRVAMKRALIRSQLRSCKA